MNDHDTELDRRIADALHASAGQVDAESLRPALAPQTSTLPPRRHIRWTAPVLAAAAVVAVVVSTVALASGDSSSAPRRVRVGSELPDSPASSSTAAPSTAAADTTPAAGLSGAPESALPSVSNGPPAPTQCSFADVCTGGRQTGFFYVPLWPFASYRDATEWQNVAAKSGTAPWHLDAVATARQFVMSYLRYTDLDVFQEDAQTAPDDARVRIGFTLPSGGTQVAAVLHLVRYGPAIGGAAAPWEVVGTDDGPELSFTAPGYASTQHSPMDVRGTSTGVDENLVVTVRDASGDVIGTTDSIPAGGTASPWSTRISYKDDAGPGAVRSVVVFNGGALITHSRFALQPFYG